LDYWGDETNSPENQKKQGESLFEKKRSMRSREKTTITKEETGNSGTKNEPSLEGQKSKKIE